MDLVCQICIKKPYEEQCLNYTLNTKRPKAHKDSLICVCGCLINNHAPQQVIINRHDANNGMKIYNTIYNFS